MKPSSGKVIIILACGVLAVSTSAIFVRLSLAAAETRGVGFSLFLAASRLTIAALILIPTYPTWQRNQLNYRACVYSAIAGLCLALHFAFWITSISFTSIAASTTLVTTNPLWIALISWIWLKEKPTVLTLLGMIIALSGAIIIALDTPGDSIYTETGLMLGNILALMGSIMVSLYFLSGRAAQNQGLSTITYIAIAYTIAAIILLPLPLLWDQGYFEQRPIVYLYSLLMAIFPQLIGHTSFNWAIRFISPTLVSIVILLEPVASTCLGFLFLQESPSNLVILGGLIVLLGVGLGLIGKG